MRNNNELRKLILTMAFNSKEGHIPSAFSIVDIIAYLYRNVIGISGVKKVDPNRDIFILSKGHGCLAQYAVLHELGILNQHEMDTFCSTTGILGEHPDHRKILGVEASTGSLGHGLPLSVGIALGKRIKNLAGNVYVLVGDGECHEGSIWEAARLATNLNLERLCIIVDANESGKQLLPIDNIKAQWVAFGAEVIQIDGHSEKQTAEAFDKFLNFKKRDVPFVIIANTTKGKGLPAMEGHGIWHHRVPNEREYQEFMEILS